VKARLFGLTAFLCGVVFALGLGIAGMGTPSKVLGFLDIAGNWDPRLAFVMAGAIAVHFGFAFRAGRLRAPRLDVRFVRPTRDAIDRTLVFGSLLFGMGWGLQGYCPGPAVIALASLDVTPIVFVVAMVAGLTAVRLAERERPSPGRGRREKSTQLDPEGALDLGEL
jgi:uncharacterized membrane protein YedE/YeeE